jgi:hypothetical protein
LELAGGAVILAGLALVVMRRVEPPALAAGRPPTTG